MHCLKILNKHKDMEVGHNKMKSLNIYAKQPSTPKQTLPC